MRSSKAVVESVMSSAETTDITMAPASAALLNQLMAAADVLTSEMQIYRLRCQAFGV